MNNLSICIGNSMNIKFYVLKDGKNYEVRDAMNNIGMLCYELKKSIERQICEGSKLGERHE